MPIVDGGLIVQGPVPVPNRYGLLSVLQRLENPSDPHWQAGLQVEDFLCGANIFSTQPDCPTGVTPEDKAVERGIDYCTSDPFTIYSVFQCPPVGLGVEGRKAFEIANARYDAFYERELEEIFWTGVTVDGAIEPSLATGNSSCALDVVDLTPVGCVSGVTPTAAIAALESALADCWPGEAVLHANYGLFPYLAEARQVHLEGEFIRTASGNRIALGAGYPGTGPANVAAAAGTTWMFGTGGIIAWRSDKWVWPENVSEATDRAINNVTVRVETTWAFAFTCCLFAILVATPGCTT